MRRNSWQWLLWEHDWRYDLIELKNFALGVLGLFLLYCLLVGLHDVLVGPSGPSTYDPYFHVD